MFQTESQVPEQNEILPNEVIAQFLGQEVLKLRDEIVFLLGQIEANEKLTLFSSGAIWTIIATMNWNDALAIVVWLPAVITGFMFVKRIMISKTIKILASYIKDIEQKLSHESRQRIGWESYYQDYKKQNYIYGKSYMSWWGHVFWGSLFTINTLIAILFPFQAVLPK